MAYIDPDTGESLEYWEAIDGLIDSMELVYG